MPTDKQNVEFLYSIIKQLEVKHINWHVIAEANTIPNGHAARMRFHRLRQAMEGTAPRPRLPKDQTESKDKGSYKRKAKEDADVKLKKKLAELEDSEDDEDSLLSLAQKRVKVKAEEERNASSDEYIDESKKVKKEESQDHDVKTEGMDVEQVVVKEEAVEQVVQRTSEAIIKEEQIEVEPVADGCKKNAGQAALIVKMEPEL